MRMRISVHSPLKRCGIATLLEEPVRQGGTYDDGGEAAENGSAHVESYVPVLTIAQQRHRLVAECAHRGKRAAEPDRERTSHLWGNHRRAGRVTEHEPKYQRPHEVDRKGSDRKGCRPGPGLDPALKPVPGDRAQDSAEGDVREHRYASGKRAAALAKTPSRRRTRSMSGSRRCAASGCTSPYSFSRLGRSSSTRTAHTSATAVTRRLRLGACSRGSDKCARMPSTAERTSTSARRTCSYSRPERFISSNRARKSRSSASRRR